MRKTRLAPAPFPSVAPDPGLVAHVQSIPGASAITAVDARPHLVRFQIDDHFWLLRGLGSDQSFEWTRKRHRFLASDSISATGLAPRPFPERSVGRIDDGLFEIVQLLPGHSWMHNNRMMLQGHSLHRPLPSPAGGLARLAATVATFHAASEESDRSLLPNLTVADYQREQRRRWTELRDLIKESGVQTVHIGRWLSASERVVYASWDVLESADFLKEQAMVACHGNLWPTHVLDGPAGIRLVDWGAARFTSPLTDIAQLVARFEGWTASALEEVVESYLAVRPLSADERRLLPVFGALDLAIETGYLLAEAYIADIDQTSMYAEAARTGAGQMLSSLEAIGWSIRKTNMDSKELRRDAKERARALREPGQRPRTKVQRSKRPKQ
ncbi:MAG TPA: phosphotransferase [Thermomicrobiales bacterium]|nr:phosphotransferase [Thermomicrobiales bacterium]